MTNVHATGNGKTTANTKHPDIQVHIADLPMYLQAQIWGKQLADIARIIDLYPHKDDEQIWTGLVDGFIRSMKECGDFRSPF
jgi:hypothetical protein